MAQHPSEDDQNLETHPETTPEPAASEVSPFAQGVILSVVLIVVGYFILVTLGQTGGPDDHLIDEFLLLLMGFVQFPFLMILGLILVWCKRGKMAEGMLVTSGVYFLLSCTCSVLVAVLG